MGRKSSLLFMGYSILLCLLAVYLLILILGCATAGKAKSIEKEKVVTLTISGVSLTVPDWVPDFTQWKGVGKYLAFNKGHTRALHEWEAKNPTNDKQFVYAISLRERNLDTLTWEFKASVMIVVGYLSKDGEIISRRICIDSVLLATGIPSFKFTEIKEFPDFKSVKKLLNDNYGKKIIL